MMAYPMERLRRFCWQARTPGWLAVVWLAPAACWATGCKPTHPAPAPEPPAVAPVIAPARPNILLIAVCTFRYDHEGAAGYPRPTTPFLDSMAADGVFFENAVSASSWTQPSSVSILTGLTPNVHRMTKYHPTRAVSRRTIEPERLLAGEIVTVAECLRAADYATFGRINNVQAGEFFNVPQGFDDQATDQQLDTNDMLDQLGAWLEQRDADRPFFAFLLTRDPHFLYEPRYEYYLKFNRSHQTVSPEQYKTYPRELDRHVKKAHKTGGSASLMRDYIDLYDAELAQLDDAFRRIPQVLEAAGCAENTVVVITADHGERFGDHGKMGHGWSLEEEVVHVPLIVWGSGIPAGRRVKQVVRSIDIYPTLAELAGAKTPDVLQGVSLMPLIQGQVDAFRPVTAFATFRRAVENGVVELHMVREGPFKLHSDGRLYNLESDPGERRNLIHSEPKVAQRLAVEMARWLKAEKTLQAIVAEGDSRVLTPEMIQELRSLGYIE